MKKLILLALLAVIMTGCRNGEVKRSGDSYVVYDVDGCEYIKLHSFYGFQHKGNCKYCAKRDSIKWEKRKAEIVELLKRESID